MHALVKMLCTSSGGKVSMLPLPLSFIKAFFTQDILVVLLQELDGVDVPEELGEHDQLVHDITLVQMRFHGLEELEVLPIEHRIT